MIIHQEKKEAFENMINSDIKFFNRIRSEKLFNLLFMTPFSKIIDVETISFSLNVNSFVANIIFNKIIQFNVFSIDKEVIEAVQEEPEFHSLYFKTNGYIPIDLQQELKNDLMANRSFFKSIIN